MSNVKSIWVCNLCISTVVYAMYLITNDFWREAIAKALEAYTDLDISSHSCIFTHCRWKEVWYNVGQSTARNARLPPVAKRLIFLASEEVEQYMGMSQTGNKDLKTR